MTLVNPCLKGTVQPNPGLISNFPDPITYTLSTEKIEYFFNTNEIKVSETVSSVCPNIVLELSGLDGE